MGTTNDAGYEAGDHIDMEDLNHAECLRQDEEARTVRDYDDSLNVIVRKSDGRVFCGFQNLAGSNVAVFSNIRNKHTTRPMIFDGLEGTEYAIKDVSAHGHDVELKDIRDM